MDFWSIFKVFLLLIFILGMMYGLLYVVKKYVFTFDKNKSKLIKIKVLSTQMILPKKFIQVVQVHDKILVLGVSDHSINLLQEFNGFISDLKEEEDLPVEFKDNFLEILKKNLGMK